MLAGVAVLNTKQGTLAGQLGDPKTHKAPKALLELQGMCTCA